MKQRVISGTMCVVVLAVVLCFYKTLVLEATVCILSAVAVFELLTADGFRQHKPFLYTAVIFSAALPFASRLKVLPFLIATFLVVSALLMLKFHSKISFEKIFFYFSSSLAVSLSFNCLLLLRDYDLENGLFYILVAFGGAWFADTGAFFTGKFLGKHKLSPVISPKKTIEGAIGGVMWNIALLCLLGFVYQRILLSFGRQVTVLYLNLAVLAVFVALMGMVGDLIASVIKRQLNIKDYGKIIPGHGGIMDRFDSILFTVPTVYFITRYISIII